MKFENLESKKYNSYLYVGAGTSDPTHDKVVDSKSNSIKVDDSAAVILYDGNGRSKMLTGKQYNALSTDADGLKKASNKVGAIFSKEKNGLNRAMMVSVKTNDMTITGTSSDNYAYIVTDNGKNKDGNASYTVWTADNQYVDVIEENTSSRAKGTLIGWWCQR